MSDSDFMLIFSAGIVSAFLSPIAGIVWPDGDCPCMSVTLPPVWLMAGWAETINDTLTRIATTNFRDSFRTDTSLRTLKKGKCQAVEAERPARLRSMVRN